MPVIARQFTARQNNGVPGGRWVTILMNRINPALSRRSHDREFKELPRQRERERRMALDSGL